MTPVSARRTGSLLVRKLADLSVGKKLVLIYLLDLAR